MFTPESVLGLFRCVCLAARCRRIVIEGNCLRCGTCCRGLTLQVDGDWISSLAHFEDVCARMPEYRRFEAGSVSDFGALVFFCHLLGPHGCTDYPHRPQFCRDYPSPTIYLVGRGLPAGCGYRFAAVRRK